MRNRGISRPVLLLAAGLLAGGSTKAPVERSLGQPRCHESGRIDGAPENGRSNAVDAARISFSTDFDAFFLRMREPGVYQLQEKPRPESCRSVDTDASGNTPPPAPRPVAVVPGAASVRIEEEEKGETEDRIDTDTVY